MIVKMLLDWFHLFLEAILFVNRIPVSLSVGLGANRNNTQLFLFRNCPTLAQVA